MSVPACSIGQPGSAKQPVSPWKWVTLGEIAEIKGGVTKGQKRKGGEETRLVPYLRVANVQRGYLDLAEVKSIEATDKEIQELALRPGDILFNEGGDRDKLGRGWVWQGEMPLCIHQNHVFRARLRSPNFDPHFVSYYANSQGQSYFLREGKQTTNLASINLTKLSCLPLPNAPLEEQRAIVDEIEKQFSRLDAAVSALKRVQANLKRYRASVLKAACEGRLVPTEAELARKEGRSYETGEQLLQRILKGRRGKWESDQLAKMIAAGKPPKNDDWKRKYPVPLPGRETRQLPKGWAWASMDQLLVSLRNGCSAVPREADGLRMLRISAVRPLRVDTDDVRFLAPAQAKSASEFLLNEDDLLFTRYNGNRDYVGVAGRVARLPAQTAYPDKLIRARLAGAAGLPAFVEIVVNTGPSRDAMCLRIRTTAGQSGISGEDVRKLPVPIAPLEEQRRIVAAASSAVSQTDRLEREVQAQVERGQRLRQAVLRDAFSGRLSGDLIAEQQ